MKPSKAVKMRQQRKDIYDVKSDPFVQSIQNTNVPQFINIS